MMRISDLLNSGDQGDEEQVAQIIDAQYHDEPARLRRAASATEYDDARLEDEGDASSGADDTGRLSETTSYASSLLDALSLRYVGPHVTWILGNSVRGVCVWRSNVYCMSVGDCYVLEPWPSSTRNARRLRSVCARHRTKANPSTPSTSRAQRTWTG